MDDKTAIDSVMCTNQAIEHKKILTRAINKVCDSDFLMTIAHFEDHGLYCVDVSYKRLVDQIDNKYIPIFFPRNERREKKYRCRVSKKFKRHIKVRRELMY